MDLLEKFRRSCDPYKKEIGNVRDESSVAKNVRRQNITSYAEIGCNVGNTARKVAQVLPAGSSMYLFDIEDNIHKTKCLLKKLNLDLDIHYFPNSLKSRDSYCWALSNLVQEGQVSFEYVYLDGSHDFTIDGLAFFLADILLVDGGFIEFDDYDWSFVNSPTVNPKRFPTVREWYTEEQLATPHVKQMVDVLVKPNGRYREVELNRLYQKKVNR